MIKVAKFTFQIFGINTYVIYDEDSRECAIIDPGMFDNIEREALDNFITREQLKPVHLINTHAHIDHVLGNAHVINKYGLTPEQHHDDEFLAERLAQQAREFGIPANDLDSKNNYVYLKEGDKIFLGKSVLKVIHVPGHSPGSIALYDEVDGILISGDILFHGSIGRADLPGGNMTKLIDGITRKLLTLPEKTIVYPGHGDETSIGYEKRYNPYLTGALKF